ncbi:hypothetical protein J2X56_003092 [Herbaspirillum sp. 1173]|uniref:hypothetical protein n=1 Tax=unclassified Herbaspirillum TaxID=2624150 RepID=UPI001AE57FF0|nr:MULTISPECIES: hypothetical protein [unclassified Herbaspirillum]MBP1315241.1 hypothetical protein [Herbaspirillum sp. 1130]MDR6741068.1 hypothetical protein [Herbaspirillum sp. 1173]
MAMETDLAITARDALTQLAQQQQPRNEANAAPPGAPVATVTALPEEGVTLSLSAQGKLMAALATAVDSVTTAAVDSTEAAQASPMQGVVKTLIDAARPITRDTLFAIEARLVAARRGADAIAAADAELPPSNDPQRLRQARQATESLYGRADNPFTYMSRAELSAIVYDESGAYTTNERYAAANQRTALDQKYWAPVFQRALESGDWKPVITAALVFYASLSALEQTAYPDNYAQLLQQYLDLYQLQSPSSPNALPPQQQADLARMLETLVLPLGPLALAGGVIRGLMLPRLGPSLAELIAAAPRLADLVQISNSAHAAQDSAYLVLLQRVFGVTRREDEPSPVRRAAAGTNPRDFLAYGDRRLLAEAYAYAQSHAMALEDIDALARDLAAYRRWRAAAAGLTAVGQSGDAGMEAVEQVLSHAARMSSEEAVIARRLLASRAASQTQLDHGFLAWLLDPAGGGWRDGELSGHASNFSALEKLLAGLAGVAIGDSLGESGELEASYRMVLERIALQDQEPQWLRQPAQAAADGTRTLTLAAQMAALARSDAADNAFMNNALMLLRMYRMSLTMSPAEQRTLAELVYSAMKKRRVRARRGKLFVAWAERSPLMPSLPG